MRVCGAAVVVWLGLALLAAACASAPTIARQDPVAALDVAQMHLEQNRDDEAAALLDAIDEDDLAGIDLERFRLLHATSLFRGGSGWKAYKVIRNFQEDHRFSDLSDRVELLHFRIGETLIRSNAGYFIFGSDKDDGETVLVEFVTRYSTNALVPDALKLTGELAFDEERYYIARERFQRIVSEYPGSEWAALAHFRLAISGYRALVGPAYDAKEIALTRNELRDYLASAPERPEFRAEAESALAQVEDWLARRYVLNAAFYRRIGNAYGELHHLRRLVREYPDHEESQSARDRIAALENRPSVAGGDQR